MQGFLSNQQGVEFKDTVNAILKKLEEIHSWFSQQKRFKFYSSSLFIIYEGLVNEANKSDYGLGSETEENETDNGFDPETKANKTDNEFVNEIPKFDDINERASKMMNNEMKMNDSHTMHEHKDSADSNIKTRTSQNNHKEIARHQVPSNPGETLNGHDHNTDTMVSEENLEKDKKQNGDGHNTSYRTDTGEKADKHNSPKVDVYMIDFSHVYHTDQIDTGYLEGLENVMSYIAKLIQ